MSNNGGIVKNIQGAQQAPLRTYEYVSDDNTAEIGMLGGLTSKLIDFGGDYAAAKAKAQGSKQKDYSPYMQAAQETRDYLESANVSPSDKRDRMDKLQSFYGPYYTPAEMKSMNEAVGLDKSITGIIEPAQQAEIDYTANIEKSIRDEATKAFPGLSPQDAETAWYLNQQNVSDISNIATIESKMTPEQRRYYRGNKEYAIQNYIGNAFSSALGELEKTNNLNENTVYTVANQITAALEGLGVDSSWANQQVQAQVPKWVSIAKEDVKYRESSLKDQQNMYALSLMPDQESFAKETFEVEIGDKKTTTTGAAVMRGEKDAPKLMEAMYAHDPKFRLAVFQSYMTRKETGNAEEATKSVRNSSPMSAESTASALKNLKAFTGKLFAMPEGNVKEAGKDAVNKTVDSALKISSRVEEGRIRPDGRPEMYLGLADTINSQAPNNGYKNSDYFKSNAEEILKGLSANFYKSIGESRVVLLDPSGRAKMINVEISGDKYRYTDVSDNENFRKNFSVRISEMIDDMVRVGGLSRENLIKDFNRVALMDSPLGNAMYRHFTGEVNPTSVWADQTAEDLLSGKTNFNLWTKLEQSWLGDAMESAYTNVKEGTVGLVKGGARSVRDVARGVLEYGKTPETILQEQRESGRVPPPQPNRPFMTTEERQEEEKKLKKFGKDLQDLLSGEKTIEQIELEPVSLNYSAETIVSAFERDSGEKLTQEERVELATKLISIFEEEDRRYHEYGEATFKPTPYLLGLAPLSAAIPQLGPYLAMGGLGALAGGVMAAYTHHKESRENNEKATRAAKEAIATLLDRRKQLKEELEALAKYMQATYPEANIYFEEK